ncbi:MAG: hypothetical protein JO074_04755 [Frankiales bacterium]|nr:hypothetical protein [Frankiales bacterium]
MLVSGVLAAMAAPGYAATPGVPTKLPAAIENLSPYQPQTTCAPIARTGVIKFRALVLATYKGTGDSGIIRSCSVGGRSEHKEGRAWDWRVSVKNATQVKQVNALFAWLFATDGHGNHYAMARRLGVMYIIWNKKIWGAYSASSGWRPYSCSGVTGCHQDHVHFSFNWAGAKAQTSFWSKKVADVGGGTGGGAGGAGGDGTGGGSTGGGNSGGAGGGAGSLPPGAPPILSDNRLPRAAAIYPTADSATTNYSLTGGHHYALTVTGVYTYRIARDGTPVIADAGCSQQRHWDNGQVTTTWTPTVPEAGQWADAIYHLAVGHETDWTPVAPDASGCSTTHTYRMTYTPWRSGPLQFSILDPDRSDDTGKLIVTVNRGA